jgi:hypothetical protein
MLYVEPKLLLELRQERLGFHGIRPPPLKVGD